MSKLVPDSDHGHPFPITIHCDHCRGTNVTRDAVARWNVEVQRRELSHVFDSADCDDCEGETRLVERKVSDGSPVSKWDLFHDETQD